MTVTLSQKDYWDLVTQPQLKEVVEPFETVFPFPPELGHGLCHYIDLRDGIELSIEDYWLHDNIAVHLPERPHPIEYGFQIAGENKQPEKLAPGRYGLCGSGTASAETWERLASNPFLEVAVHIDPSLLQEFLGESCDLSAAGLAHLIRPAEQRYYTNYRSTTNAMQVVLHQMLQCPFQGVTRKVYLESKVWELMALIADQELQQQDAKHLPNRLRASDVERIHYAKEILIRQLDNPPSLLGLARQVGLNDYALKQGFRQVFGETAFGYLHSYRMEKARQLLLVGEVNVSEAARQVGFANRSYFAAAFRKKYGVTPSQYLRKKKNSD